MAFELFGFDIFLDEKLRSWLLEVIHSPSFTTDNENIKSFLIADTLNLINITMRKNTLLWEIKTWVPLKEYSLLKVRCKNSRTSSYRQPKTNSTNFQGGTKATRGSRQPI